MAEGTDGPKKEVAEKEGRAAGGTLVKFGQPEHILQFQGQGLLYMNNLPYFWNIEDECLRGDPLDSVARIVKGPKVTMSLPDGKEVVLVRDYTASMYPSEPDKTNIFCMYALRPASLPVHKKNFRFGSQALVLLNPQEFLQRVASSLKTQGIKFKADLVDYVGPSNTGEVGPFTKFKPFSYQSEWRLVCPDGPGGPREIEIGSIRDISVMIPSSEINTQISVQYET